MTDNKELTEQEKQKQRDAEANAVISKSEALIGIRTNIKRIEKDLSELKAKEPSKSNKNSIYKKIAKIQAKIKGIARTAENKFQGYKYFTEDKAMLLLKPLLEAENIASTWTDTDIFFYDRVEGKNKKGEPTSEHILRYLKEVVISDGESEPLIFNCWATGQDPDISKAKGKAETYAMKYFLSKFWMIPVVDTLDADQQDSPDIVEEKQEPIKETPEQIKQREEAQAKANEFLKKHGLLNEKK